MNYCRCKRCSVLASVTIKVWGIVVRLSPLKYHKEIHLKLQQRPSVLLFLSRTRGVLRKRNSYFHTLHFVVIELVPFFTALNVNPCGDKNNNKKKLTHVKNCQSRVQYQSPNESL